MERPGPASQGLQPFPRSHGHRKRQTWYSRLDECSEQRFPLVQNAEKHGYRFSVIDSERYDELHNFMLNGQNDRIEAWLAKRRVVRETRRVA